MFIDLLVGQIRLRAIRDNQRKLHSVGAKTLAFDKGNGHAQKNDFAYRSSLRGRLRLKFPVQGDRNVNRCANGLLLHNRIVSGVP